MSKPEYPSLLAPGIQTFDAAQLKALFVDEFPSSVTRTALHGQLTTLLQELRNLGLTGECLFDGSFTTQKEDPADIDVVVVIDPAQLNALGAPEQQMLQATLLNNAFMKGTRSLDVYYCPSTDQNMLSYWRGWFGFTRDGITAKGIARATI